MAARKKARKLGTFGTQTEGPEVAEFDYFGATIRTSPKMSQLDLVDFLEEASALDDGDPMASVTVKKFLRNLVHEDDFDTLWAAARANGQGIPELLDLAKAIVEGLTKRPTGPQSDSSEKRPQTEQSLEVVSSSTELTPTS